MKKWEVSYRYNKYRFGKVIVEAETYTMALLRFVVKHPDCEYFSLICINNNKEMIK